MAVNVGCEHFKEYLKNIHREVVKFSNKNNVTCCNRRTEFHTKSHGNMVQGLKLLTHVHARGGEEYCKGQGRGRESDLTDFY